MVKHAATISPRNAELTMQRDAAELLYKNSFASISISIISSSALVFGFDNPDYSFFQHVWLSVITTVLVVRLLDVFH
jgi:hypothetical protein